MLKEYKFLSCIDGYKFLEKIFSNLRIKVMFLDKNRINILALHQNYLPVKISLLILR